MNSLCKACYINRIYLTHTLCLQYKLIFENHKKGGVPFLNLDESQVIFSNIPQLYDMQRKFTAGLKERIDQWRYGEAVGELFYDLVSTPPPPRPSTLSHHCFIQFIVTRLERNFPPLAPHSTPAPPLYSSPHHCPHPPHHSTPILTPAPSSPPG